SVAERPLVLVPVRRRRGIRKRCLDGLSLALYLVAVGSTVVGRLFLRTVTAVADSLSAFVDRSRRDGAREPQPKACPRRRRPQPPPRQPTVGPAGPLVFAPAGPPTGGRAQLAGLVLAS